MQSKSLTYKIKRLINIIEMLTAYRATPDPAMGIESYTAMEGKEIIRNKARL